MKTLKRISLGRTFNPTEMTSLRGGSDINEADYCSCSGSTQTWFWCDDNKNTVHDCTCYGNDNNKNSGVGCSCGIG